MIEDTRLIELVGISKDYDGTAALKDINLYIRKREFVTLLGPSGCGKTTMLRIIAGFEYPTEGTLLFEGKDIASVPPYKRRVNTVFQKYALFPHLNVYDNIAFGLKLKKMSKGEIAKRVTRMLKLVKMTGYEKRAVDSLSGGQQQRIAIGRSLLLQPDVLLLDEPFSALDAKIRSQMREELRKIQTDLNITVVFVTHDQEEAMALSDRIVVMNKGVFEQIGSPQDIYNRPVSRYVADFIGEMNFIETKGGVLAVRPENITARAGAGGDLDGYVRNIMMLGHYLEMTVDTDGGIVKLFVSAEEAARYKKGDEVALTFGEKREFERAKQG